MSAREWDKLKPWMLRWPSSKIGRCYKRGMNKAKRRKAKMEILGIDYKNSTGWESQCDWKIW